MAASALLGIVAVPAFAAHIEFIHEGVGSGMVGNTPFKDAAFTITAIGDEGSLEEVSGPYSGLSMDHLTASISIFEVGDYKFITPTGTHVDKGSAFVIFSLATATGAALFIGPTNSEFVKWDMLTPIDDPITGGPISGTGELLQWSDTKVDTSGGQLVFVATEFNPTTAQFRANDVGQPAVPEPGTLGLLGLALAAFGWMRRKALS